MNKVKHCIGVLFPRFKNTYAKMLTIKSHRHQYNENMLILAQNKVFKGVYSGKRCFILGNGPSLNKQDLSILKNEYVFTANKFSKIKQFEQVQSNFHFVSDLSFFETSEKINDLSFYEDLKRMKTGDHSPAFFFTIDAKKYIEKNLQNLNVPVNYFWQSGYMYEGYRGGIDFTKMVFNLPTVVCEMVLFAIYAGFGEIYLLGCDCTGILAWIAAKDDEASIQAYAYTDSNKNVSVHMLNNRWNSERYFEENMILFQQYRILYEYCQRKNVKLFNCTQGGILDAIPRKKLEDVVNEKRKDI